MHKPPSARRRASESPFEVVATSPPGQLVGALLPDASSPMLITSLVVFILLLLIALVLLLLIRYRSRQDDDPRYRLPTKNTWDKKDPPRVCRASVINASECGALLPNDHPRSDTTGTTGINQSGSAPPMAHTTPTGAAHVPPPPPPPPPASAPAQARSDFAAENIKAVTIATDEVEGARGGGWGDLGGFESIVRDEYPTTRRPDRSNGRRGGGEDDDFVPPPARRGVFRAGPPAAAPTKRPAEAKAKGRR